MKKALSLLLVLVLALGMSTVAFAKGVKIDRTLWDYSDNLKYVHNGNDIDEQDGRTATVFNIYATGLNVTPTASGGSISKDDLNASEFDVRLKWSKGSQVLDEATVEKSATGQSYVKITYAGKIKTVGDIDFKYSVIAVINGRSLTSGDDVPVVEGTYVPEAFEDWDDDWFEFDGQNFVKPNAFIRNMEFSFSEDVSVFGRALKGVKYYGYADDDVSDADQDLMVKYAAIVGVYHLQQLNVLSVTDHVKLNNVDGTVYVYDGDLNYLGRGNSNLPYADTYYIAAAELDVDTDVEPDDEDGDEDYDLGDNSEGGGDDLYPSNPHDNPGTGK